MSSDHYINEDMLKTIIKAAILEAEIEKEKDREQKYLQKGDLTNSSHIISHSEWRAFKNDWDSIKKHIKNIVIGAIVAGAIGVFGAGLKMSVENNTPQKPVKSYKVSQNQK